MIRPVALQCCPCTVIQHPSASCLVPSRVSNLHSSLHAVEKWSLALSSSIPVVVHISPSRARMVQQFVSFMVDAGYDGPDRCG